MHPRNRFQSRYVFPRLVSLVPELGAFVHPHPVEGETIDFSDPRAVKVLNRALFADAYGILDWDIPEGYLCPPLPGRADMLHHLADLVGERGPSVRVLDVGVGANCVYPLVGHKEYGWSFVGVDVDEGALGSAARIVRANGLESAIALRRQPVPEQVFRGAILAGETFALTVCNPPFYASADEARAESARKWRHLGKGHGADHRNFGGQGSELWCKGGEAGFLSRMASESARFASQVQWFSSLVSQDGNVPGLQRALKKLDAAEVRAIEMRHGQKKTRVVAWRF